MRIVVTGNRGFIGSHLEKKLRQEGHDVVGVDLKDGRDILKLTPKDFEGVQYVFHMAAQVSVPGSIENPLYTARTNDLGTYNVLECARQAGVRRVIFSSTCAVYGTHEENDKNGIAYTEDMKPVPTSPYGLSKLTGEHACRLYSELYKLDTVCLRYFNVFGEGMKVESSYSSAVAIFLEKKKKKEKLQVYGGQQTRDFVYVGDVVEANLRGMKNTHNFSGMIINIGTGFESSIESIAKLISDKIEYLPQRAGEMNRVRASKIRAVNILGWVPTMNISSWICAQ